jgi:low affinity Fe/Cu permease
VRHPVEPPALSDVPSALFCHIHWMHLRMRGNLPVSALGSGHKSAPSLFGNLAAKTSHFAGRGSAFLLALGVVMIWAISGPFFHYSDTWQLVINTGTTIVTFLMVFLIQHTQNRDTLALQLKLDELIIATQGARNSMACIEEASEEELEEEKGKVRSQATTERVSAA